VLVGIFAPEAIVYIALGQWVDARTITRKVNEARNKVRFHSMQRCQTDTDTDLSRKALNSAGNGLAVTVSSR